MALYDPENPNSEDPTLPTAPAPQNEPAPAPQVPQMAVVPDMQDQAQSASLPAKPVEAVRMSDEQAKKLPAKVFDAYKDPDFLNKIALTYLDNGFPEGLAWLAHAHNAVQNGQLEANQRLIAGDGKGAVEALNRTGGVNYDVTDATKNSDGTWTMTHGDGSKTITDPNQEMASMLSPEQFLQNEQHKAELNAKIKLNAAQIEMEGQKGRYYGEQADFTRDQKGKIAQEATAQRGENARLRAQGVQQAAVIRATPQMIREETRKATEAAKADAEGRYSTLTTFNDIAKQYRGGTAAPPNGDDGKPLEPTEAAAREMVRSNGAVPLQDPNDPDHIVLVDPAGKKAIFDFGTKAEYKRITGRAFVSRAPPPAAAAPPLIGRPQPGPPRAPPMPQSAAPASPYANGMQPTQTF